MKFEGLTAVIEQALGDALLCDARESSWFGGWISVEDLRRADSDKVFVQSIVESVADYLGEIVELRAQREAVLELHHPVEDSTSALVCGHRYCVDGSLDQVEWPCPTARALGVDE